MYNDIIIKLADLGLRGNKGELVKFLQVLAAESSNKNKHKLYNELLKLLDGYSNQQKIVTISSNIDSVEHDVSEDLWFTKSLHRKLDRILSTLEGDLLPEEYKGKFNKLLLYGPPGSGKTTIGHYMARRLHKDIEYIKLSDVISYKFGETLKNLASIFENNHDSIIFIDEFDAFAKSRFDSNDVGELKRIVNSLIQTLDVLAGNRIVIVATNLKDDIDPAIMRRFPIKLSVPELNKVERFEFLNFLIENANKNIDLNKSQKEMLNEFMIALNLKTVDAIKGLFDATIINSHIRRVDSVTIVDFFETMITDGILDSKQIKKLQDSNPELIQKMFKSLEKRFTKIEIAEYVGVHRNSIGNYAQ
jgi:Cdc6-like AAA superfamily ATPase